LFKARDKGEDLQVLARRRVLIAAFAISVGVSATGLTERVVASSGLAAAVQERAAFGLAADEETVKILLTSGLDTGTAR
jgi:hypothetical protein